MNHSWTVSRRCVWLAVALAAGCGDDYGGNVNANQNGNGALPVCGNGVLETGETCDDGAANSDVDPDACRTDCRPAYCGDGVVDTGEACDEGEANSDRIAGACRRSCAPASCGDGVVDPGEGCDDGNAVSEDGCAWTCEVLPGFACEGQPSVCACQPYWHHDTSGAATNLCGDCRVHVVTEWDGVDPATQDGRTWETALSDLQAAIDLAADLAAARLGVVYCSVWVKMGPYYLPPMGQVQPLQLRHRVKVMGGFSGTETTLAERARVGETLIEPYEPGALRHLVVADGVAAALDALTLAGGEALGDPAHLDDRGATLFVDNSSLAMTDCTVRGGRARLGGGLYANGSMVSLLRTKVESCEARDEGGGLYSQFSGVTAQDATFLDNVAGESDVTGSGGAVSVSSGRFDTAGSRFLRNRTLGPGGGAGGGAIHLGAAEASAIIRTSLFLGNQSGILGGGGALHAIQGAGAMVLDSTFLANEASLGGALHATGTGVPSAADNLVVSRCWFLSNAASRGGAVAVADAGTGLRLGLSVLAGNRASQGAALVVGPDAHATLANLTVWDNLSAGASPAPEAVRDDGGTTGLYNSLVWHDEVGETACVWSGAIVAAHSLVRGCGPYDAMDEVFEEDPGAQGSPDDPVLEGTVSSSWTDVADASFRNVLQIAEGLTAGEHAGRLLALDLPTGREWFLVETNGPHDLTVLGRALEDTAEGVRYRVLDLHPTAGSTLVDRGDSSLPGDSGMTVDAQLCVDVAGVGPAGESEDIGAYEYLP